MHKTRQLCCRGIYIQKFVVRYDLGPELHFSRIWRKNRNPVYGVATICHQVRWLRWGLPSLFHTTTSLLIWYEMFCVRDISYTLILMEFINMFSVYAQSGTHSRLIDRLLWFQHTTLLFWCVWRSPTTPNSCGNKQKHGYLLRFQVSGR